MGGGQFNEVGKQVNKLYSDLTRRIIRSNLHKKTNQNTRVWNKAMQDIGRKDCIEKFMKLNKAKLGRFKRKGARIDGVITVTYGAFYGQALAKKHMKRGFNDMWSSLKKSYSDLELNWPKKM